MKWPWSKPQTPKTPVYHVNLDSYDYKASDKSTSTTWAKESHDNIPGNTQSTLQLGPSITSLTTRKVTSAIAAHIVAIGVLLILGLWIFYHAQPFDTLFTLQHTDTSIWEGLAENTTNITITTTVISFGHGGYCTTELAKTLFNMVPDQCFQHNGYTFDSQVAQGFPGVIHVPAYLRVLYIISSVVTVLALASYVMACSIPPLSKKKKMWMHGSFVLLFCISTPLFLTTVSLDIAFLISLKHVVLGNIEKSVQLDKDLFPLFFFLILYVIGIGFAGYRWKTHFMSNHIKQESPELNGAHSHHVHGSGMQQYQYSSSYGRQTPSSYPGSVTRVGATSSHVPEQTTTGGVNRQGQLSGSRTYGFPNTTSIGAGAVTHPSIRRSA